MPWYIFIMILKFLLTLAVLLGAYAVLRARLRAERVARGLEPPRPPLVPRGTVRLAAGILLAVMVLGTALYLIRGWLYAHEVVQVQVVNANTGRISLYEARRGGIQGRGIRTLDGREIRLADVERMIILPEGSEALR